MPKCRFCSTSISWKEVDGKWMPIDATGSIHCCENMIALRATRVHPYDAICAKCWKPMIWARNQICSCLNPIYVEKCKVSTLKAAFLSSQSEEKRLAKNRARQIYHCVICEALAVSAGDSVICTADSSHIFPMDYYRIEISAP